MGANTLFWTDDRIEELTKLRGEGRSCGQIAAIMGQTRSAIIGKLYRLGIPDPNPTRPRLPKHHNYPKSRKSTRGSESSLFIEPQNRPLDNRPQLTDLDDGHIITRCRYSFGEPKEAGFFFCGDPVVAGLSWCHIHCGMVFLNPCEARKILTKGAAL